MAIFRSAADRPSWCELEQFDVLELNARETRAFPRRSLNERILVTSGYGQTGIGSRSQVLREGQFLDCGIDGGEWKIWTGDAPCRLVILCGRWGENLGGCGLFSVRTNSLSLTKGDPVNYPKTTGFDCHYHDCDEYWLVLEGTGTVVVGGHHSKVAPGDWVATGMGHHHDFPEVDSPVKAVYFETTLEGRKRIGHLWQHTHGPAQPKPDRI